MRKQILLPRLALSSIKKSGAAYLPYILACIFSVFTVFSFGSILNNDLMKNLPRASYASVLLLIGFVLLQMILIPFLFYTNSFLIKRRKKELGLYSILGMEKKHIGIMLLWETVFICGIVLLGGILLGIVFSKLFFLLFLNLANLPVEASFSFRFKAVQDSFAFFGLVSLLNLISNLVQLGKSNPTELLQAGKKGEKNPRFLWLFGGIGFLLLCMGYYITVTAKLDSNIYGNFFLAVFFVAGGTYFLFTSGSIVILRGLKKSKHFYYKPEHFITVSGMLYRMKKSAGGLVNICIFSTMVIITVLCTAGVYLGTPDILHFQYPYDLELVKQGQATPGEPGMGDLQRFAVEEGVSLGEALEYSYMPVQLTQKEDSFYPSTEQDTMADRFSVDFITVDVFNQMEGKAYSLESGEVLLYSSGDDYGYDTITLMDRTYSIQEELPEMKPMVKAEGNNFQKHYFVMVKDEEEMKKIAGINYVDYEAGMRKKILLNLKGQEEIKSAFIAKVNSLYTAWEGWRVEDNISARNDMLSMVGGLLFIGVFFGFIFSMCLVLVMYYKQIAEGYEDKESFDIMQKVGMSDEEVRKTIKRQILLIFFLPLFGAILHTLMALNMMEVLFSTLNLFNSTLVYLCGGGVILIFALFYGASYGVTAGSYYKIVKKIT